MLFGPFGGGNARLMSFYNTLWESCGCKGVPRFFGWASEFTCGQYAHMESLSQVPGLGRCSRAAWLWATAETTHVWARVGRVSRPQCVRIAFVDCMGLVNAVVRHQGWFFGLGLVDVPSPFEGSRVGLFGSEWVGGSRAVC